MTHITYTYIESPLGMLLVATKEEGLCLIQFEHTSHPREIRKDWQQGEHPVLTRTREQLNDYFAGTRTSFDLPLAPDGTEFQQRVWQALTTIKYGETLSYSGIAERIGSPKAVRAVGAANGRNPLPIVVPCHRVIGANGSLTGFAAGLEAKQYLLALEREGVAPICV